jgi:hypothetical protein
MYLRICSLLTFTLLCSVLAHGQANNTFEAVPPKVPCTLDVSQAPTLRGFRLRESWKSLSDRFPGLASVYARSRAKNPIGAEIGHVVVDSKDLYANRSLSPKDLRDVVFHLIFLDHSLLGFYLEYADFEPDGGIAGFIDTVSTKTKLPSEKWMVTSPSDAEIQCAGFSVRLWTGDTSGLRVFPSVGVYDRKVLDDQTRRDELWAKQKLESEQRKREFRP